MQIGDIKDHIGNICAVVNSAADTLVQGTVYYASGVPMESSFDRDEQPYLYNGKEFIEAHGLNEYDSQARMYYATIMRTTTMDPMAEKYYHLSPYSWCGNNPIAFVDPDGKIIKGRIHLDAKRYKQDIQNILSDDKFKDFNSLLKIKKTCFLPISQQDLHNALEGQVLKEDEAIFINILVNFINDKDHIATVEYVYDEISEEGISLIKNNCPIFSNLRPEHSYVLMDWIGGGMTTSDGEGKSYSFIDSSLAKTERMITAQHEVLGHGIPIVFGFTDDENNSYAIRLENVVRRLLSLPETLGEGHQGNISNPTAYPEIPF